MKEHITPNLMKLARLFKKKGELYIVGGYVRNALLGIYNTDIDIASKLTNDEIKEILFGTKYEIKENSKKMGTMTICLGEEKWQHSTFRKEVYPEGGEHKPISVEFTNSVEEDSKRRDFTANCVYYNILKDEYVDVFNGIEDIHKKTLKAITAPSSVLENDGLRILRMIRLASELGFRISSETILAAYDYRDNLKDISGVRKYEELNLILNSYKRYKTSKPNAYMFGLQFFNLLKLWPYFNAPVYKVRYDITTKIEPEYRLHALLIDIISTAKYNVNVKEIVKDILGPKGLCFSESKVLSFQHIISGYFDALNKMDNKSYFLEYYDDFKIISALLEKKSKKIHKKYDFYFNYLKNYKIPIRIKDLKINGLDIKTYYPKIKEKNYKDLLTKLLEAVFDGKIKNEKEELLQALGKLVS